MENKRIRTIISVVALLAVLLIIGFLIKKLDSRPSDDGVLKVGVITVLTGPFASYGEEMKKGILAATPIEGVEFIFEDDKCEPKAAVSAFTKLVDIDKVDIVIGPGCGSPQEAVVPLLREKNVVALVPSAAARELFEQSGKNFFNVQYSLQEESVFVAEKMNAAGYKKVAFVGYRNAFSETHEKAFKETYTGEVVEHIFTDSTSDLSTSLAQIKNEQPDAIYSPDASFFFGNGVLKLRQYGVEAPIFGTYVTELPAARPLVPDVIYSFPSGLGGEQGAVYELSKQAAELAMDAIKSCNGSTSCIRSKLISSDKFDMYGVYKRSIFLKEVKDGQAISKPE